MSFTVGQRICERFEKYCQYEDARSFGKIVSFDLSTNKYKVQWESSWRANYPSELSAEKLMTEEEANTLYNKMDTEFHAFADLIESNMAEAGRLIEEAAALANKNGYNINEMWD